MSELYRCGWCGQPTEQNGGVLDAKTVELVSDAARWDTAISVHGECCLYRHEQHNRRERCTRDMAIDAGDLSLEGQLV